MPAPLANWNPARDAWETSHSHIDLFSELSAVYSETFPSWGMTRGGVAYELPTSAPPTAGSVSSSSPGLLPTPHRGVVRQIAVPDAVHPGELMLDGVVERDAPIARRERFPARS